ncbi:patatin-like phospholipase family protein [Terrarubrum flagellatum]|uniref:patatin-like phospholipase family protein n=1 Tax=Terrirubrum flagellatum TaxID=2895980 RepID=UPI0031450778
MSEPTKSISLALQGGGAHGAFTWGVLDAFLADGRIRIDAISGTSAGAVNGALVVDGFQEGGAEGARKQLDVFWRAISGDSSWTSSQRDLLGRFLSGVDPGRMFANAWFDWFSSFASPYDFNPLNLNPLRDLLDEQIDFKRLRAHDEIKLFVTATNVRSGKIKVFEGKELTADHVMASACLPLLFHAVEINGEAYWDGGYMGNPALFPLFYGGKSADVLLVQLNPIFRNHVPTTAQDIQDRLNEITFNSSLLREFRAVDFVQRLVDQGLLPQDKYMRVRMHRIDADKALKDFDASTKMDSGFDFLLKLKQSGQRAARAWLKKHFDDLGVRETLILRDEIT